MKRIVVCFLGVVLLMSVAGCTIALRPVEATLPALIPTNDVPTEATIPPTQPSVEKVQPLEILVANQYLGEWSDNYIHLAHVSWQDLALSPEAAKAYPGLEQALLKSSREAATWSQKTLQEMLPDAKSMAGYMGSDFYGFSHETVALVQRADTRILSVRRDFDAYTGGARPYYGTNALNLDPETGDTVPLSAVVTDVKQLPGALKKALLDKYPELAAGAFDDIQRILGDYAPEDYVWTLDYQGMTFYFGQAEIAPAVAGVLSATLWFDQYPELFAEEFTEIPEQGYGRALSKAGYTAVDLKPGDEQRDSVYVSVDLEGTIYIHKNEETLVNENSFCYSADSYLVTPDNQHFYLYVDTSADNDYSTLWVYDLSGDGIRFVAALPGEGMASFWYEGYPLGENRFARVFNDPSHFEMAIRVEMLGTMTGGRSYHMDTKTGVPVADVSYFLLDQDREPLVSKIPLKLKLLPTQMEVEIPVGTKLWFLRTDNETYVDVRGEDGKQYRIYVTHKDWRGYINGIPEEDCFTGIMYAG